jgi:hypothetical protein
VIGKIGLATTSVAINVVDPSPFDLVVTPDPGVPSTITIAAARAVAKWRRVVRQNVGPAVTIGPDEDQCGALPPGGSLAVAGIRVRLRMVQNLGVAATGGPCIVRSESGLALTGMISINTAGPHLADQAIADRMLVHELGHVLGIGTWWFSAIGRKYYPDTALTDPYFTGPRAIAAFLAVGGAAYAGRKVPVEIPGGTAAPGTHWRGSVVGANLEVMQAGPRLSAITIAALADMGWSVDENAADLYTLPTSTTLASIADARTYGVTDRVVLPTLAINANALRISLTRIR